LYVTEEHDSSEKAELSAETSESSVNKSQTLTVRSLLHSGLNLQPFGPSILCT